jgi:hypothetical protein
MTESPELSEVDHDAHFRALSDLADLLDGWVTQWAEEADKAAQSKPKHEHQEDAVISVYQHVGFVEMARGHALVSSITAFCESLFKNQLPLLRWSFKWNLPSNIQGSLSSRLLPPHFGPLKGRRARWWFAKAGSHHSLARRIYRPFWSGLRKNSLCGLRLQKCNGA